jgi:hypothetical protein
VRLILQELLQEMTSYSSVVFALLVVIPAGDLLSGAAHNSIVATEA